MATKVVFGMMAVLAALLGVQTYRVSSLQEKLAAQDFALNAVSASGELPGTKPVVAADSPSAKASSKTSEDDALLEEAFGDDGEVGDTPMTEAEKLVRAFEEMANANPAADAGKLTNQKQSAADERTAKKREALAMARKVQALIESGDYEEAASLLREAIENGSANAQAYSTLANLYRKMGMQEEEIQLYRDWITNRPDDAAAHYMLAGALERNGMNAEALQELAQFEQLSDSSVSSYSQAASLYRRLGDRANEGRVLQEWTSQVPNSPDARLALAQYYMQTGNYAAAVGEYTNAAQLLPGSATAHVGLARAYQQSGDFVSAQAEYSAAMTLRPDDMGIRLQLGESYRRSGDAAAAIQVYQDVISTQPDSQEARRAAQAIRRIERQMQRAAANATG